MKILVACEESQRVCTAFRERGHEAYSCDLEDCSGNHPEWHIMGDVLPLLNGRVTFQVRGGSYVEIPDRWDMIIAFPPCTYLTHVATRHHSLKCASLESVNRRTLTRIEAMGFFMKFCTADCDRIAVENPVGIMNTAYRKPDQIIHPYQFADGEEDRENYVTKGTCLWLKGLPPLSVNNLPKPDNAEKFGRYPSGKARTWEEVQISIPGVSRAAVRSKTFPAVARAMGRDWG